MNSAAQSANRFRQRTAIALLTGLIASGCGTTEPTDLQDSRSSENVLHSELERGPVKVEIDIVPKEPRLSDEPTLTLTVTADSGIKVELPPFGQSLGDFVIRDFHEPNPKSRDGKQILQHIYTLEPLVSGSLFVSPLIVKFTDHRPDGNGNEHTIETEPIKLEVATMIGADAPSLADLRPVAAPVDLPTPGLGSLVWWLAGGSGLVLVAGLFLWRRRRNRGPTEPQLTPQQLAWRELNDLLRTSLSDTNVKEYFVQLTAVVRRYIERITGVNAPDQTTEEFLREVNGQQLFTDEENRRLGEFLESADLVKFAGYQPDPEAVKQSTNKARQFIELRAAGSQPEPQSLNADTCQPLTEVAE